MSLVDFMPFAWLANSRQESLELDRLAGMKATKIERLWRGFARLLGKRRRSAPPKPHPANAPGDFYVEEGCCLACGASVAEAPDLFAWVEGAAYPHCAVFKQPQTKEAFDRAIAAMWSSEVDCIRYRGKDPDILRRIAEMGHADLCDVAPPGDAAPLTRSHVSFRNVEGQALDDAKDIASGFVTFVKQQNTGATAIRYHAEVVGGDQIRAAVRVSWVADHDHIVEFERVGPGQWLGVTKPAERLAAIGLSRFVDTWLRADQSFTDLRWFTKEQWQAGGSYRTTVI